MTRQSNARYKRSLKSKRRDRDETTLKEGEFSKLKRKLRIMENDRKSYSQEVNNILRKQGKEIGLLAKENSHMHQSLSVAYGKYHLRRDIENTKKLKDMLEAREDYKRLIDIESNTCRELDAKVSSLQHQLVALKKSAGGHQSEMEKKINTDRHITKLEKRLNQMTKEFCGHLHENAQMKDKIKILVKEKKIYQDLYNQLTQRISAYKAKIMSVTQEASSHYEQRLEAMNKMKTLKERSAKDESLYEAEMKILQRMIDHDTKLKDFMSCKENERLGYKAEEAEKRAKMSIKERFLGEESQHVQKMESLFHDVKVVTGHGDLEHVVQEYTAKDDENFSRFDYVSELNYCVEKLREEIQQLKDNIARVNHEDMNTQTACDSTVAELKKTHQLLSEELSREEERLLVVDERLETICGTIHLIFKRIGTSADHIHMMLAFEDKVTPVNLKMYLGVIEQRFLELVSIIKFISLHQDHHGNLLRAPRSIHRIRPRGPSKILLAAIDMPTMPSVNTPNMNEEVSSSENLTEEALAPLDIGLLREKAIRKIAKKEAAGLLNAPLFTPDKRRPKAKKKV